MVYPDRHPSQSRAHRGAGGGDLLGREKRAARIFRTWKRHSGSLSFASNRTWWRAVGGESMGLGLAAMVLALSLPVEAALWNIDLELVGGRLVRVVPGFVVALAFGGVWLLGAWLYDDLLCRRLPEPTPTRVWFRLARSLVAGFPGLGLASVPIWQKLAAGRPPWAYGHGSTEGGRPVDRFGASGGLVRFGEAERRAPWMWALGILVLLVSLVWLAAPSESGSERRIALFVVAIGLHALGLVGTVAYVRNLHRRGASRAHIVFAGLWLLPLPFALGAFAPLGFRLERVRPETLTWTAYARSNQPGRLKRWSNMEQTVRGSWLASPWWLRWLLPSGRRRRTELTRTDWWLLRLGGVKVSLLLVDGIALGWIGLRVGGQDLGRPPWLGLLVGFALVGIGSGILIVLGCYLAAGLRLRDGPRPLGGQRQMWAGASAVGLLGLGLLAGAALARGDQQEAGLVLVYGSVVGLVVVAFALILQVPLATGGPRGLALVLSWCGLFLGLVFVGVLVAESPVVASGVLAVALGSPLWHGLFFRVARRSLERCLGLFVSDGGAAGLAGGWRSVAMTATAALPLGGLGVPWWLRIGDRRIVGKRGAA